MPRTCQVGGLFHRCRNTASAVCQYCGREFCAVHTGARGDDEICSRPTCVAKHDDLKLHVVYRAAATERSNRGFCGVPDCTQPRAGQCSKCHAVFCDAHLFDREETVRQGMTTLKRPICVCEHCGSRIKLWSKS